MACFFRLFIGLTNILPNLTAIFKFSTNLICKEPFFVDTIFQHVILIMLNLDNLNFCFGFIFISK